MKTPVYILLLISLLIVSCETVNEPSVDLSDIPFVVEGWIEDGQAPVVMVTHAVDLTVDEPSFENFVEKWCRVSIWDGNRQYILTSRINNDYTPSIIFTSSSLKGQVGHTYRLVVECEDRTLSSSATMLPAPKFERLVAESVADIDSLYSLRGFVSLETADDCFKFFVKTLSDGGRYFPSFLGTLSARDYDVDRGVVITRGKRAELDDDASEDFTHYFKSGDLVIVRVCSLEPVLYDFWHAYDANVSLSDNLFFTFGENLPSNIEGGLGYFAAYGSSERLIRLP